MNNEINKFKRGGLEMEQAVGKEINCDLEFAVATEVLGLILSKGMTYEQVVEALNITRGLLEMEVKIKAEPKEIADLVTALQNQRKKR